MCGIIGVSLKKASTSDMKKVFNLIQESSIRGIHATGISLANNGKLKTHKVHEPACAFLNRHWAREMAQNGDNLLMVGHTRYSTSDLRYNQPLGDEYIAIVHNGVISQEPSKTWGKAYGLKTKTSNDSELILSCINNGEKPLEKFNGSMAVCTLTPTMLTAFRNGERPLWYHQQQNGVIFASTKDILLRSGFKNPIKCDMFTEYVCVDGKLTKQLCPIPVGTIDLQ